jgi:hypothetical protein
MRPAFLFLSLFFIMFTSCKKDDQGDSMLLRSVFSTYDTIEYFYTDGRLIKKTSTNKDGFYNFLTIDYSYYGGVIDSILYDTPYAGPLAFIYILHADTLVRIESRGSDHTVIRFFYDNDYQVQAQSYFYFTQGSHGTWYSSDNLFTFQISGGNIVKCIEKYRSDASVPYVTTDTITYSYDDRHNPFSTDIDPDVLFFPYNMQDFRYRNKNNITSEVHSSFWSPAKKIEYSYAYNSENYPETAERKTTDQFGNVEFYTERYNYMKK